MPGYDEIEIEILEDGTIKATTDPISGPNHLNADKFLEWIVQQAGGSHSRQRRGSHSHHGRVHTHDKVKA